MFGMWRRLRRCAAFCLSREVFSEAVRQAIYQALERVQHAGKEGADQGGMAYAELDFLAQRVVEWCDRSAELFYKRPECIWLDDDPLKELEE